MRYLSIIVQLLIFFHILSCSKDLPKEFRSQSQYNAKHEAIELHQAIKNAQDEAIISSLKVAQEHFIPIPKFNVHNPKDQRQIQLAEKIFYDNKIPTLEGKSCQTCHNLDAHGTTPNNYPTKIGKDIIKRNPPSVHNAALNIHHFRDGRSLYLESAIWQHLFVDDKKEKIVISYINKNKKYTSIFTDKELTSSSISKSLTTYLQSIVRPSRFDRFLNGDTKALSLDEVSGMATFIEIGCTKCHNGVGIGGGMTKKLGEVAPFETTDKGKYLSTQEENDIGIFKVASLRNVAETSPYLHNGSVKTLDEIIVLMARNQLGEELKSEQIESIKRFLSTLTSTSTTK